MGVVHGFSDIVFYVVFAVVGAVFWFIITEGLDGVYRLATFDHILY